MVGVCCNRCEGLKEEAAQSRFLGVRFLTQNRDHHFLNERLLVSIAWLKVGREGEIGHCAPAKGLEFVLIIIQAKLRNFLLE